MTNLPQSYKLLENGEPADDADEHDFGLDAAPQQLSKSKRRWLEFQQSIKDLVGYGGDRKGGFGERLPPWLVPFCERWTWAFILAGNLIAIVIVLIVANAIGGEEPRDDILQYIDPLIGTGPGGHVFAGATLPFGMAKPVADVFYERFGGFASSGTHITGFSHLHDSGTGGSPSMGNFPVFIQPACPNITTCRVQKFNRRTRFLSESVSARVGYFAIELASGLRAEMTASDRAALYSFSFANGTDVENPVILVDGSDLPKTDGPRELYVDADTGRMTAQGIFIPSFGEGNYTTYMCADFKGAQMKDVGVFNSTVWPDHTATMEQTNEMAPYQGVYVRLRDVKPTDKILVRVGVSWLSRDRACQNMEREIKDWDFARLVKNAEHAWTKKLSPIKLDATGVDEQHLRNFWSGVYRAFISPQDYTGENPLWDSTEPHYESWYCIWDTFRGVHPFYMLIDTVSQSRMVRSLIDIYKHAGWLPDCRMAFCKGFTQGGSNADVVLVDSYMKKLKGVNWDDAYAAVIKDAEESPPNWDIEGRGGLKSWKSLGYIPLDDDEPGEFSLRSVSRTVEYAYNDFVIAQMAKSTGREDDYKKYAARANNWKNIYDDKLESMGFTGFPQPRLANGTFVFQNATLCSHLNNFGGCYIEHGAETYEGSPWLYLFYVPGDMAGLIKLLGGRQKYLDRLHKLHNSGVLYMGDEQAFLTAFLYHFAGRPGLSAKETHQYIPSMFNDTLAGIPGNDDSGAMGTFVFFSMLGIFPSAGQSVYFIIPPFFPSVSITNPQTSKTATIRNVNFDPTYKKIYIQSARLNGKTWTKNWLDHSFFLNGGTLDLVLGEVESSWGTGDKDLPPSLSTGLYFG